MATGPDDFPKEYISKYMKGYMLPEGKFDQQYKKWLKKQEQSVPLFSTFINFNSDKVKDWVGFLRNHDNSLDLYCICSTNGSFEHKLIYSHVDKDSQEITSYFTVIEPGEYRELPKRLKTKNTKTVKLENQGIHLSLLERSSLILFMNNHKIEELWTSE